MDRASEMKDQNINRLLFNFSLPAIVGMLVNSLYNIVDRIFLGRSIGYVAIAATTVAMPIMIIFMAISVLISIGATALISIRLGENKKKEAEVIAGNAMAMLIILPAAFAVGFMLYIDPILIRFGVSADVFPYAKDFLSVIMLGSVFGSISMGMNNFIRAEGNPKRAMSTQLLGAAINVVLNYVFVMRLNWGVKGSALATITGQFVSALWVLSYFYSGKSLIKIRLKNLRVSYRILLNITAIGFGPFAMQIAHSAQNLILIKALMRYGGDLALSASGVIMSVAMVLFMPILGVSQGAQPIIGYNYGAKQFHRVRETLRKAVFVATGIALVGYLAINLWPNQIVSLFSEGDMALTDLSVHAMKIFFLLFPLVGFQIIAAGYFQAVGKGVHSAVLSLSRQLLFFIPLLLILPNIWGLEGIWRTPPIADALSIILTGTVIFFEMKKMREEESKAKKDHSLELTPTHPRP